MRIQLGLITVLLFWISSAATSQAQQITLTGSEWLLEDLGGSGVLDRIEATLTFPSADKVSGNGSCNRFFGPAQIDGEKIELGPLGSTRMSCPEAVMNQETEYLNALQASEHWEWKSPYLLLYTKGLTKPLRFTRKQVDDSHPASAASERDLTQLFGRIWKLTVTRRKPASNAIYIFLANGTLLETSCSEKYRVATWTIDKEAPSVLRVVEDGQLAFTAAITELTDHSLHLRQDLVRSKDTRDIELKPLEREFLCPYGLK